MTEAEFHRLPFLLTRNRVIQLGITEYGLRKLEEEGRITYTIVAKWRRYHRVSVAKILGFKN
jgi:hypothetical protein